MPAAERAAKSALPKSLIAVVPASQGVADSLSTISKQIDALVGDLKNVRGGGGAIQIARAFVVLHRLQERMKTVQKMMQAIFDIHKKQYVPEALEAEGVTSLPLSEGFRVGVSSKLLASIPADNRAEAYKWLRKNQLGPLIIETVAAASLSAAAKAMMEEENKELPQPLFTVHNEFTTSVTGGK